MLQKLKFVPGFNKQATESGAESQWVDGDFVRLPKKHYQELEEQLILLQV